MLSIRQLLINLFVRYETQKVVQIRSWRIGLIYRCTQFSIVLYIALWVMWRGRGYQAVDIAMSGVTAKLKGVAFTNLSHIAGINSAVVWDVADYVVPPQQNSAFFVLTNLVLTPHQSQSVCGESWDITDRNVSQCRTHADCLKGELDMRGSGVKTGRCVPIQRDNERKFVCEIYGWCPTEDDRMPLPDQPLLSQVVNFTVLIKNNIEFPRYGVKRRNILKWMDKKYLATCRYVRNHPRDQYCPIFLLGDILRFSDAVARDIWVHGGFVSIHIKWDCDLDWALENCRPVYTFRRLDDESSPIGRGWNFRFGHIYYEHLEKRRTLVKAYGVQFFITVEGRGRKFDVFAFTMNLGSGLALLWVATFLCDMIVLHITAKRNFYREAKIYVVPPLPEKSSNKEKKSPRRRQRVPVLLNSLRRKTSFKTSRGKTAGATHDASMSATNSTSLPPPVGKKMSAAVQKDAHSPEKDGEYLQITAWCPDEDDGISSSDAAAPWYYMKPTVSQEGRLIDVYVADSLSPLPDSPTHSGLHQPVRRLSPRNEIFV